MRRLVLTTLIIGSSLLAGNYGYSNPYSNNNNNNDTRYEGMSGTKYKYDLSNPSDRINYSTDLDAQMNDKLNTPINSGVGLDRSMGQYGGGIQDK